MSAPPATSSNPFDILELDRSATFEDVKLAYRRLARQYHPDANPNDPSALERFTALRRAYDRLKIFYQTLDETTGASTSAASAPQKRADVAPGATTRVPPPNLESQAAAAPTVLHSNQRVTADETGARVEGRNAVPEPAVAGTGNRRAFVRTGPMRAQGAPPAAPLTPPQVFGGPRSALRAELIGSYATVPAGAKPWMFYSLVSLRASETIVFPRVPLNLCLVLDHSSSMLRAQKVDRLKETVHGIIDQLEQDDILSIVTFGDRAEVLLPAQPLRDKAMVHGAVDAMRCRGGTEISRGLAAGLSELGRNTSRAFSHLILLTDGQTSGDEMACLASAEEAASMTVGVTAYGLGSDWNNALLDGIAAPSGGHSDYIESSEAMASAFMGRVHGLQSTILRNVTLGIQPTSGVTLQRATLLSPMLRPLEDHGTKACKLGDLSSDTDYRLLCEFVIGPRPAGMIDVATLTLRYDVPGLGRSDETLAIPVGVNASPDWDLSTPVDPRVLAAQRHATVHRLQQQAWAEITSGNTSKGTTFLRRAAEHLEASGHGDLAAAAMAEAARVEGGAEASDENVKRIMYGTRKLG